MRNRILTLAGATAVAAGLAACGSNPMQPVASYPSTPVYPGVSSGGYPPARCIPVPARRRPFRKAWKWAA